MSNDNPDMTAILLAAMDNSSAQNREAALNELRRLSELNFAAYVGRLTQELGDNNKPNDARQLAGLMLKQALEAKTPEHQLELSARWMEQKEELKRAIRGLLLPIMGSPIREVARTAGLLVAKIAAIDYPKKQWPELLNDLSLSSQRGNNPSLRMATYDCLGFLCEDIPEYLGENSNVILNMINLAMQPEESDNDVKHVATRALANAIQFARENFKSPSERASILKLVFSACASPDDRIRREGFFALARIPEFYYEYLDPAIMDPAFKATTECMIKEKDEIAQQAIEFWCSVCERELENELNHQSAIESNWSEEEKQNVLYPLHNIMKQAVRTLAPTLLITMTKKENYDEDTASAASYASFCLNLCAQTVKNDIIPNVVPFIQEYLRSPDWNKKEAAVLAFGCIIDGPDDHTVNDLLQAGFREVLSCLIDDNPLVKDSAAWVLGQVCNVHPDALNFMRDDIFKAMLYGFKQSPKVAGHICWAVQCLSDHVASITASDPHTNALSPAFGEILTALFWCSERPDPGAEMAELVPRVFEAINHLIAAAAPDVYPIIQQVLPALMKKLSSTLERMQQLRNDDEARYKVNDLQAMICGSLHCILQTRDLPAETLESESDNLMALFIKVLEEGAKHAAVVEDAFICIGCIASRLKARFQRYLDHMKKFLFAGLRDASQVKVLITAIGLTGDLARALGPIFMEISHDVMRVLLTHLQANEVDRAVKPHVINCIADIALAIEGEFTVYMPWTMPMLVSAAEKASHPVHTSDIDEQEFFAVLRESLMVVFWAILQALMAKGQQDILLNWNQSASHQGAFPIIAFMCELMKERGFYLNSQILGTAAGFILDFAAVFDVQTVENHLRRPEIKILLERASADTNQKTRQDGDLARRKLERKIGKKL